MANDHQTYKKPPTTIKDIYKTFHKLNTNLLDQRPDLIDLNREEDFKRHDLKQLDTVLLPTELRNILLDFLGSAQDGHVEIPVPRPPQAFEVKSIPGLMIYPSLLPPQVQISLLDKLLRRELSNSEHKTNVHFHHEIPYPETSFFDKQSSDLEFKPRDAGTHKPISTQQFLNKKLRWLTLGGQYDWTNKVYPSGPPPPFPKDIAQLLEGIFPMKAEAAIVNLYSPGDTLSLHRDVSEECAQPLVSISLGCEGIFTVGLDSPDGEEARFVTMRLGSGDAVLMSGKSRFAWHGVPKVLEGTCPDHLQDWPAVGEDRRFDGWRGWMKGKRVNLNVRQMFD